MIRNWGIRNRVLLLALLPTVSLGMVMGSYFIRSRVHDLKSSQSSLGHALANQLASASGYGVYTGNSKILQALAQAVAQESNVESVTIIGSNGRTLAKVTRPTPEQQNVISNITQRIGAETGFEGALAFSHTIFLDTNAPVDYEALLGQPLDNRYPPAGRRRVLGHVVVTLSEARFAERQAQVIINSGIIVLACLALAILLALAISGSVAVPIAGVISMVQRFSFGDFAARVRERSGGEIGQLEHGINEMASRAQRSQHELQEQVEQATAEMRETLEEMEIKSVELDLARKRALEASRSKSEFLANMSHEIRTPMNAVLGFGDLLMKTPLNEGQRSYLATIRQSARLLLALLDDVLWAAQLETHAPAINVQSFKLDEVLEEIVQVAAMDAYSKGLELVLLIESDAAPPLLGDRVKLTRVLTNLIMNAIKFTDSGSVVLTSRSKADGRTKFHLDLRVIDTGIGIRERDQRRLFEPFSQVDSSAGRRHGGTGLGLYISRKLMEQMSGSLTLTSTPGCGSEFRVSATLLSDETAPERAAPALPDADTHRSLLVYEPHPQAADALIARLTRLGWQVWHVSTLAGLRDALSVESQQPNRAAVLLSIGYDELREPATLDGLFAGTNLRLPRMALVSSVSAAVHADISRLIAGPCLPKSAGEALIGQHLRELITGRRAHITLPESPALPLLQGLNVVVADDNRINRVLVRTLLEKHGARVREAETGRQVAAQLSAQRTDLILLDMHMPGEDGWQVAKALKAGAAAHIPIVALSAMRYDESVETLAARGLDGWLVKPLEEPMLLQTVKPPMRHLTAHTRISPGPATLEPRLDLKTAVANLRPSIREMLTEDIPAQQQAIAAAWAAGNYTQLEAHVHKLNGSAAFCHFSSLRDLCNHVQGCLSDRHYNNLPQLLGMLTLELQDTLANLVASSE